MRTAILLTAVMASVPALDLLDRQPCWTSTRFSLGIAGRDAEVRDGGGSLELTEFGVGLQSFSGYSDRPKRDVGLMLGGSILLRGWYGKTDGTTFSAWAPILALDGGVFAKPSESLRFEGFAEAGLGLGFTRIEGPGGTEDDTSFKPFPHLAAHLVAMAALGGSSELGLDLAYSFDYLPDVTVDGPTLALVFTWTPGKAADK